MKKNWKYENLSLKSALEIVPEKIFTGKKLAECTTAYDICDTDGNLIGLTDTAAKQRPSEILKSRSWVDLTSLMFLMKN